MTKSMLSIAALLAIAASVSSAASAATPALAGPTPGQWTVEVTTVATRSHFNTAGICIKADHTWSATSDRSGSGRWLASGGTVMWRGNYSGGLNDAAVLSAPSATAMSGPLMQWVAGSTDTTNTAIENVFANSSWRFVSATCDKPL
jgi:hypothetical protein